MLKFRVRLSQLRRFYCTAKIQERSITSKLFNLSEEGESASKISFTELKYPTKVPLEPIVSNLPQSNEPIDIDTNTIQVLERLSLVELDSKEALDTLKSAIQFANKIVNIDTEEVQPLYTVLEDKELYLRDDDITDGNIKDDILRNAQLVEEDYFVAPPGNIPLEQVEKKFE